MDKSDNSILEKDDNPIVSNSQSQVGGQLSGLNSQALEVILSQLTSLLNKQSALETKDSPMASNILVSIEAVPQGSYD